MLIDFNLKTCSKYIHAQEATVTSDNPILDTDTLSLKGKKLLTTLLANNFYIEMPKEDLAELVTIVEDLTNTVSNPKPVTYNTKPYASALTGNNFLAGTGFGSEFATNVEDGIVQLTLAPANASVNILGPSVSGAYPKADSEISVAFAITAVGDRQVEVFKDYDIQLHCNNTPVLKLINNVWTGIRDPEYLPTGTVANKKTIQNITRESYLTTLMDANTTDLETWTLVAKQTEKNTEMSINITVPKPEVGEG